MPVPRVKKGKWSKERERTKSGRWRKKRSDADQPKKPKRSTRKYVIAIGVIGAIVIVIVVLLTMVAYSVYAERRVSALIQDRFGPNRVGPQGLLQPIADIFKLALKEDIVPDKATKSVHTLAPMISLFVALTTIAVVPFGNTIVLFGRKISLQIADVNVGILYILALTSLGVYGITLSGWSSNNKYSLFGGLRSSAQMISYELSMGLSVIGVILITGSLSLQDIVLHQYGWRWNIILQPIGFITFLVASFAETNRAPFDLPEAEPELGCGLPYRILQHEIRNVLSCGICKCNCIFCRHNNFISWRMAVPVFADVRPFPITYKYSPGIDVFYKSSIYDIFLYLG